MALLHALHNHNVLRRMACTEGVVVTRPDYIGKFTHKKRWNRELFDHHSVNVMSLVIEKTGGPVLSSLQKIPAIKKK